MTHQRWLLAGMLGLLPAIALWHAFSLYGSLAHVLSLGYGMGRQVEDIARQAFENDRPPSSDLQVLDGRDPTSWSVILDQQNEGALHSVDWYGNAPVTGNAAVVVSEAREVVAREMLEKVAATGVADRLRTVYQRLNQIADGKQRPACTFTYISLTLAGERLYVFYPAAHFGMSYRPKERPWSEKAGLVPLYTDYITNNTIASICVQTQFGWLTVDMPITVGGAMLLAYIMNALAGLSGWMLLTHLCSRYDKVYLRYIARAFALVGIAYTFRIAAAFLPADASHSTGYLDSLLNYIPSASFLILALRAARPGKRLHPIVDFRSKTFLRLPKGEYFLFAPELIAAALGTMGYNWAAPAYAAAVLIAFGAIMARIVRSRIEVFAEEKKATIGSPSYTESLLPTVFVCAFVIWGTAQLLTPLARPQSGIDRNLAQTLGESSWTPLRMLFSSAGIFTVLLYSKIFGIVFCFLGLSYTERTVRLLGARRGGQALYCDIRSDGRITDVYGSKSEEEFLNRKIIQDLFDEPSVRKGIDEVIKARAKFSCWAVRFKDWPEYLTKSFHLKLLPSDAIEGGFGAWLREEDPTQMPNARATVALKILERRARARLEQPGLEVVLSGLRSVFGSNGEPEQRRLRVGDVAEAFSAAWGRTVEIKSEADPAQFFSAPRSAIEVCLAAMASELTVIGSNGVPPSVTIRNQLKRRTGQVYIAVKVEMPGSARPDDDVIEIVRALIDSYGGEFLTSGGSSGARLQLNLPLIPISRGGLA